MKAYKLRKDSDIEQFYKNPDYNIYFREGDEGEYEPNTNGDLRDLIDATCHGFEIIAVQKPYLREMDIELEELPEQVNIR